MLNSPNSNALWQRRLPSLQSVQAEIQRRTIRASLGSDRLPPAFSDLLRVRARYKGRFGGRGSAKSHSFAEAALIRIADSSRPLRVLCAREIQRSIKESVKLLLDRKISHLGLTGFISQDKRVIHENGSEVIFEGLRSNVTAIQSLEAIDIAWVEEAQSISQSSLDILIPTIRAPGSELWFSWNPRNAKDPVDRLFRGEGVADDDKTFLPADYDQWMISRRVNFDENPFFPEVLRAEMERDKRRDPERYAHIWLGEYQRISEARVFKNWSIGTMAVPEGMRPYQGADWGFSIDPTVLVRCYVFQKERKLYVDAEVSKVNCPIDKTPELFDTLDNGAARKWPIKADSSRPETIQYMQTHGYPKVFGARKGPGSVEEGVEFLKNFDIVVHPNCRRVIDELTLYSFEVDKLTNDVLPTLADKDNHVIDALRYAVEDLRRGTFVTAGPILVTEKRTYFGDYVG
jgi:phage terminase large subunit